MLIIYNKLWSKALCLIKIELCGRELETMNFELSCHLSFVHNGPKHEPWGTLF